MTPLEAMVHNPRSLVEGDLVQTPDDKTGLLFALGWQYGRVSIDCIEPDVLADGKAYLLRDLRRKGEPPDREQLALL